MTNEPRGEIQRKVQAAVDKLPERFHVYDVSNLLPDLKRTSISSALNNLHHWTGCLTTESVKRVIEVPCKGGGVQRAAVLVYRKVKPTAEEWRGPKGITWTNGAATVAAHLLVWPGSPAPLLPMYEDDSCPA